MTAPVSYMNLIRAQQKPLSKRPVVAFASADDLIASHQQAHARLMGKAGAPEPTSMSRVRPYQPFRNRDYLDVRTPVPAADKTDNFGSILPQSYWRVICREVCEKHGVALVDLLSVRRSRPFVLARHEAMFRMRHETNLSYPQIGQRLGGRDHTTVLHGVREHARRNGLTP